MTRHVCPTLTRPISNPHTFYLAIKSWFITKRELEKVHLNNYCIKVKYLFETVEINGRYFSSQHVFLSKSNITGIIPSICTPLTNSHPPLLSRGKIVHATGLILRVVY